MNTQQLFDRLRAAGIHLGLSALVAALAAALVFFVWYPFPYREVSGGRELFTLVVAVDVVLGPLLTFAVFNRAKPLAVLKRDLAVIVALQLAALAYGMYTVAVARPVHLVYEIDRFRVVHAVDLEPGSREKASTDLRAEPWLGPTLLAVRPFKNNAEQTEVTFSALGGVPPAVRPQFWQAYPEAKERVAKAALPLAALKAKFAAQAAEIDAAVAGKAGAAGVVWLPMISRHVAWTVLLDASTLQPIAYLPLDSF
jgi:hypothetical protein